MAIFKALVDKLLTNVSQGYVPQGYISESLLTPLSVLQSSGKIGKFGAQHLRIVNSVMGGRGKAPQVTIRQYSSDSYFVEAHGLEEIIAVEEYDNVEQPFDIEQDVTMQLTTMLWLGKEKALHDIVTDPSIITQGVTLAGTAQWSDYVNSTPIKDINTARLTVRGTTGAMIDTMTLEDGVFQVLRYHPTIVFALGFAYARAGSLSPEELGKAFSLKRLLIADVVYNNSVDGQADSLTPLWGKTVLLSVSPTSPGKMQKTLGYYVTKKKEGPRKVYKQPVTNPPEAMSIIVKDSYDMLITDANCGYLIQAAIA